MTEKINNEHTMSLLEEIATDFGLPLTEEMLAAVQTKLEEAFTEVLQPVMESLEPLLRETNNLRAMNLQLLQQCILNDFCRGLPLSTQEKLRDAAVDVNVDPYEDDPFGNYVKKLESFKKMLFAANRKPPGTTGMEEETFLGENSEHPVISPAMAGYLSVARHLDKLKPAPLPSSSKKTNDNAAARQRIYNASNPLPRIDVKGGGKQSGFLDDINDFTINRIPGK